MRSQACQSTCAIDGPSGCASRGCPSSIGPWSKARRTGSLRRPRSSPEREVSHDSRPLSRSRCAVTGSRIPTLQSGITNSLIAAICQSQYRSPGDERRRIRSTSAMTPMSRTACQATAQASAVQDLARSLRISMASATTEPSLCLTNLACDRAQCFQVLSREPLAVGLGQVRRQGCARTSQHPFDEPPDQGRQDALLLHRRTILDRAASPAYFANQQPLFLKPLYCL